MKIRVYLAFSIARLQISKFIKKLYRQSKLLLVASKLSESRYKSSLNDRAFSFLLTSLFFVGFFPVLFDIGDVSNQVMSARVLYYSFKDESEIHYYALGTNLSHTA